MPAPAVFTRAAVPNMPVAAAKRKTPPPTAHEHTAALSPDEAPSKKQRRHNAQPSVSSSSDEDADSSVSSQSVSNSSQNQRAGQESGGSSASSEAPSDIHAALGSSPSASPTDSAAAHDHGHENAPHQSRSSFDASFATHSNPNSSTDALCDAAATTPAPSHEGTHIQSHSSFEAHSVSILQLQYASSSSPPRLTDSRPPTPTPTPTELNWKAALRTQSSTPLQHRQSASLPPPQLDFALVKKCATWWSLSPGVHTLVRDFNTTGDERLLIEFTQQRNDLLNHVLAHLNYYWAVITSTKTMLVERVHQAVSGQKKASVDFVLRSKGSFRDAHENKLLHLWSFNEAKSVIMLTVVSLVDLWLKSDARRTCANVVFDPSVTAQASSTAVSSSDSGGNFNLWRGFSVTFDMAAAASRRMGDKDLRIAVKPFLNHVREIWCKNDAVAFSYCLKWMASLVQRPWRKLGVAIVLQGQPGSGKGIIINSFLGKIIGTHHYSQVTGLKALCGQFNAPALATACLVFVDEAMSDSNKQHVALLKTLITEPTHTIENKYAPSLNVESFVNYILSSNEEHVVEIDHKDRRYFALQTDNRFSGPETPARTAHVAELLAVPVLLVARYLYTLDVTDWNPQDIPTTDLQRAQKRLMFKPTGVDTWLLGRIEANKLPSGSLAGLTGEAWFYAKERETQWGAIRPKAAVFDHYAAKAGPQHKSAESFWRQLQEIVKCHTTQKRIGAGKSEQWIQFPSLGECKSAFRKYVADDKWAFAGEEVVEEAKR